MVGSLKGHAISSSGKFAEMTAELSYQLDIIIIITSINHWSIYHNILHCCLCFFFSDVVYSKF